MSDTSAVIAIYDTHTTADNAVKELQKSGFDMKKLSIVGKDYQTDEQVVGFYNAGDRMKYWGKLGAFWGGLFGLLVGAAFFWVPGIGPMVVAGPLTAWIVAGLEGALMSPTHCRIFIRVCAAGRCPDSHCQLQHEAGRGPSRSFLATSGGTYDSG